MERCTPGARRRKSLQVITSQQTTLKPTKDARKKHHRKYTKRGVITPPLCILKSWYPKITIFIMPNCCYWPGISVWAIPLSPTWQSRLRNLQYSMQCKSLMHNWCILYTTDWWSLTGHRPVTDRSPTGHRPVTDWSPTGHSTGYWLVTDRSPTGHRLVTDHHSSTLSLWQMVWTL